MQGVCREGLHFSAFIMHLRQGGKCPSLLAYNKITARVHRVIPGLPLECAGSICSDKSNDNIVELTLCCKVDLLSQSVPDPVLVGCLKSSED